MRTVVAMLSIQCQSLVKSEENDPERELGAAYQNVGSVDSIHSGSRLQRAPLDG